MSADWLRLNGVESIGKPLMSEQIGSNIMSFFNWGLLNVGGFTNVTLSSSGTYGGDKSRLRPVIDPNYTNGKVWEGFSQDWVWESGIEDFPTQPIRISGVWINNTFYQTSSSGTNAHYINYRDGQIVFNTPISTDSIVKCEYSYRWARVVDTESDGFRGLVVQAERVENPQYISQSGQWNTLSRSRITLPVLGVEVTSRFNFTPDMLGGGQILHQDVNFIILSDNRTHRNKLVDLVRYNHEKTIRFYDLAQIPLTYNYNGTLSSGAMTYPNLVNAVPSGFFNKLCRFEKITGMDMGQLNNQIFVANIRATLEIHMHEI